MRGAGGRQSGQSAPRSSGGSRPVSPTSPSKAGGGGKPPPPEAEAPDYQHLILAAQHENMRRLGREIPFGIALIRNGDYRQILGEDQKPFDWFRDLP